MNQTEVLVKLDDAIKNNVIHHSARASYETWSYTPDGRQQLENILKMAWELKHKADERKAKRIASRKKEAVT